MRHSVNLRRVSFVSSLVVVALVASASRVMAQGEKKGAGKEDKMQWMAAPPVFAPGAKMAVISGNPMAAGSYVVHLSMPSHYTIAPHWHPTDEHLKIVKGAFRVGMGDRMDATKTKQLNVGDTITAPAKAHHYAMTEGKTVVEVSGMGPFQLTYVNPADMPKAMHAEMKDEKKEDKKDDKMKKGK